MVRWLYQQNPEAKINFPFLQFVDNNLSIGIQTGFLFRHHTNKKSAHKKLKGSSNRRRLKCNASFLLLSCHSHQMFYYILTHSYAISFDKPGAVHNAAWYHMGMNKHFFPCLKVAAFIYFSMIALELSIRNVFFAKS